jgi:Phytanoyl-CoA dioxygenase (PhyH)
MAEPAVVDVVDEVVRVAGERRAKGDYRGAIDQLTEANRRQHDARLERALVETRLEGAAGQQPTGNGAGGSSIPSEPSDGQVVEVDAADMTVAAVHSAWAQSGCLLVRGLVAPDRVARLCSGIDAALAAFDATEEGERVDKGWYSPRSIHDRAGSAQGLSRKLNRQMGALWTVFSPRMLFELFEVVDDTGVGALMTDFLGERPHLSANKCTLRRVPPEDMLSGWHQDGAFLGEYVGAFNVWITLTDCGRDAPGLDIVPRRFDHVLPSGDGAIFKWSLSEEAVKAAAGEIGIVRPEFRAGDALLFDHRLVHRTASASTMAHERYAIESWFFAPSAYPKDQVPLLM